MSQDASNTHKIELKIDWRDRPRESEAALISDKLLINPSFLSFVSFVVS